MPRPSHEIDASALSKCEGARPNAFERHPDLIAAAVLTVGFCWRLWLAQATFFSPDEAWHFSLANQASVRLAYRASLTISHPPLLILVLYYWRALGTSNLVLRLPSVIAGTVFCRIFYQWLRIVAGNATAWTGLVLATFLGPMITMSADVRQYPLLLMFSAGAAYFLERALLEDSAARMIASAICIDLAMLSHYSAFFVAGALGVYAILRLWLRKPLTRVLVAWVAGQISGVALAMLLYKTHIGRLGTFLTQSLLPQQYLSAQYFHKGHEHLFTDLYRGTFGVFRFVFGQTQIGQFSAILFLIGLVVLWGNFLAGSSPERRARHRTLALLLLLAFILTWIAAAEGLYPYGRMRQCLFLAMFVLAGVSVCIARIAKNWVTISAAGAIAIVLLCHAFGTSQDRDAIPLADQRHEHMDQAMQFLRSEVAPGDVILTDKATSYQLRHYLCHQKPIEAATSWEGFEVFRCEGFLVWSTGPDDGALTPQAVAVKWFQMQGFPNVVDRVWVIQGGWATGLGEELRGSYGLSRMEIHTFGHYLEVLKMPPGRPLPAESQPAS